MGCRCGGDRQLCGDLGFRFFGETGVLAAGQALHVGTPRQQAVLAALLVDAGAPVALETLIDRVWGGQPPAEARSVLYSHLSRIRRLLEQASDLTGTTISLERRHAGYVISLDAGMVDLHRFRHLADQGRDTALPDAERATVLAEALSLWRGTPLAGVPGLWAAQVRDGWQRLKLETLLHQAQVELRLGRPETVIAALPDAIAEHPLVEPLEELLMRALHAAGRDAEALDRYTAIRQRLADELGADPGPDLQTLHQEILRGGQPAPSVQRTEAAVRLATPAQLPPGTYGFTGRENELHQLDRLLAATREATTVVISAVSGTAGVGKTALALHWAHRVRDQFPDGQLYVNLRGFDPTGTPVTPAEAVRGFLDAFEVPPQRIPPALEAQIGLFRSLLAGKRVLVLLDNARDSEQARTLLPGVPGCLAIVTSRSRLTGMIAATGAQPLALDLLTVAESRDLLVRRLGQDLAASDPRSLDDIIEFCARLPLALAIVAARAATHPGHSLAALTEDLRAAKARLDEFADPDLATDVRAVFSWSYEQLSPQAAQMFRILGLHPGPHTSTAAAASLAGVPAAAARRLLVELTRANLVDEQSPGRYTFHDLLRAYAAELVHEHDSDADRHAALHRVLDHYLHTAGAARSLLEPHSDPISVPPPQESVTVESLSSYEEALIWCTDQRPVVLAAINRAYAEGFDGHVSLIAWTFSTFLDRAGHWQDWQTIERVDLAAASRQNDRGRQAIAHRGLGRINILLGRLDEAQSHLRQALDLSRLLDDRTVEALTHMRLAMLRGMQGRHTEALHHSEQALELYRLTDHRVGQAGALNEIGSHRLHLGDYEQALVHCTKALRLQEELGDDTGRARSLDDLGLIHFHLGELDEAIACHRRSAELYQDFDEYYSQATALTHLGDAHQRAGDPSAARQAWQRAEDIFHRLGHPDADQVQAKLHDLADRTP